jgi:hypothetical protein
MDTSVVDIYGHIPDKSEVLLGVGNYNNVHGLLTYFPAEELLQMRPLPEVLTPSVLSLVLTYESIHKPGKVYFSLAVKGQNKYINVQVHDHTIACAHISSDKAYFWIDYSSVDATPRSQLLAGALYSLQTTVEGKDYVVSWKIQGFSNGDLVIFLPTTWYEQTTCEMKQGLITLVESLHQIGFKGYTTQRWCEDGAHVIHCTDDKQCGICLGPCKDPSHICYLTPQGTSFMCGPPQHETKLTGTALVSFNEESNSMGTTGTIMTWCIIAAVMIMAVLMAVIWVGT